MEVDRKDLSETNSKLKGPIWKLRNLKDQSETNMKLKGPEEVFGLNKNKQRQRMRGIGLDLGITQTGIS